MCEPLVGPSYQIALKLVRSDLLKNGKINNSNVLAESASGTESNGERIIEELLDSGEVATLKSTDSATTLSEDGESEVLQFSIVLFSGHVILFLKSS